MARSCRPPVMVTSPAPPPPVTVIVPVSGSLVSLGAMLAQAAPLPPGIVVEATFVGLGSLDGLALPFPIVNVASDFQGIGVLSGDATIVVGGGSGTAGTFRVGTGRIGLDTIG